MHRAKRGFSLIELMITVGIIGVLLALAAPSFATYLRNAKVRSTAEAFMASMQLARSEAVRMNVPVEFLLTAMEPTDVNVAAANAAANGTNWMIRTADRVTFIEGKFGAEGSGRSTGQTPSVLINDTAAPASTDPDAPPAAPVGSVVFNGLGRTNLAAAAVFKFNNPEGGTCVTAGGPIRCLHVVVSVGGQARLCDPAVSAAAVAAGDSRGC
jgi:type IV fimbrial biogenesis protein FimT